MAGQLITLLELRAFRNAYLLRSALVWVLIRLTLAFQHVMTPASESLDPEPLTEMGIIGVVGLVVLLDARRRSEDLLLGNLGIPTRAIALMAFLVALLLELVVP